MAKKSTALFLTLATQTLLNLSVANPIPNPSTGPQERDFAVLGFNGGYGYPYAGLGGCAGPCAVPCFESYNTVCNNGNQCNHKVAYENHEHAACNVCKDSDTAYCANNDACCQDNKLSCFNLINKKAKRDSNVDADGEFEKRCKNACGLGACNYFGACGSPCGFSACDYGCGGCKGFGSCNYFGACGSPCGLGACGYGCGGCEAFGAYGLGVWGLPYGLGACGLPCDGTCGLGYGYLKKRDLSKEKRCDTPCGFGYGYGVPYGGYGACGSCGPYVVSSNSACDNTNQCCGNVAYENRKHVACNVCKDCDTAYCANKDACCQDNKLSCFNLVNKKAKRDFNADTDGEFEKRCENACGLGACNYFGACGSPCGFSACDYGCGGCKGFGSCNDFGACGSPCGLGACGYGCDGCEAFGTYGLGACGLPCDGTCGFGYGCLKKRDLSKEKRCDTPYGFGYGYGVPYGGYGACGSCGPYVASSNSACNNAGQCCGNVAYENCKHVSCNVCKDCDTAYCANKDACRSDCAANCFLNTI